MSGAIEQKEASVGILVGVEHAGRFAVLLQQRADHDTYARACQVTAHGELTADEMKLPADAAFSTALGRKLRQEIGPVAAEMVEASLSEARELNRVINKKGRLVVTMGVSLPISAEAFQKLIVPGADVAGFKLCAGAEDILPLEGQHKETGVPAGETRMFRDEIESVRAFFSPKT